MTEKKAKIKKKKLEDPPWKNMGVLYDSLTKIDSTQFKLDSVHNDRIEGSFVRESSENIRRRIRRRRISTFYTHVAGVNRLETWLVYVNTRASLMPPPRPPPSSSCSPSSSACKGVTRGAREGFVIRLRGYCFLSICFLKGDMWEARSENKKKREKSWRNYAKIRRKLIIARAVCEFQ